VVLAQVPGEPRVACLHPLGPEIMVCLLVKRQLVSLYPAWRSIQQTCAGCEGQKIAEGGVS